MQETLVQFLGQEDPHSSILGLPLSSAGKESPAMWGTWVEKILWRRERLLTLVFWPGEFQGLYSPWGPKEWDVTQ